MSGFHEHSMGGVLESEPEIQPSLHQELRGDNDAKVTDATPSNIFEEEKNTTLTAGTNQIIAIIKVEADIASDRTAAGGANNAIVTLGYSIENSGDAAKTTADADVGMASYNNTALDCTSNTFVAVNTNPNVVGAFGKSQIVRFWLRKDDGAAVANIVSYCVRNARVTYNLLTRLPGVGA